MLTEGVLMCDSLETIMSVMARLGMLMGTARSVRSCVRIIWSPPNPRQGCTCRDASKEPHAHTANRLKCVSVGPWGLNILSFHTQTLLGL